MLDGLDLSSPSTSAKVNRLVIRYLQFRSVRGDLQEGHGCASRCQFLLFLCRSPFFSSTKSGFLCAFAFGTLVFGRFEHKIEVFVRFWCLKPPFSGVSSTKSGFLCSGRGTSGIGKAKEAVRARQRAPRGRQPAPQRDRKRGARGRHMLPRAPGALRLQLLLVGCVLWVEVGPAGKPVV